MNIKVTGKDLEITDAIRGYITDKADRLEKFEGSNTELTVVCKVEREDQIAEMQLSHNGEFIKIEEKNDDLYAAIDLAFDRLERQMRKAKEKVAARNKSAEFDEKAARRLNVPQVSKNGEVTITRGYSLKPLTLEDAKLALSDSAALFLTYVDFDTKQVNVLYKRVDGDFGLVIPE
ncbi:MAG: ribosome-associated translation inhibitor RaiA [Clostridia bacterium]|nr:ribosome-associated translation inhibitor RaiA [Clostridia bacterium]